MATRVLKKPFSANRTTRSSGGLGGCISEEMTVNLRTWVRALIVVAFSISGLVDTLSATGLVVELSPDGRWGPAVHTLAVSGPLQLAGAALVAFGRQTRWVLSILGFYVLLVSVLGNLPLLSNPDVGGGAFAGLLGNLAIMGGISYWFLSERMSRTRRAKPALPKANPALASPAGLLFCQDSSGAQILTPTQLNGQTAALPR